MVTLVLLVSGKGHNESFWCAGNLLIVLVAQVCSPNILNYYLALYMFLHVCYTSIKRKN